MDAPTTFQEAIQHFIIEDPRYPIEAYLFVRDGFEYVMKRIAEEKRTDPPPRMHLTGAQLSIGLKDFALDEFGPMAAFTLAEWNIRSTYDFGELVYNLIKMGLFSKTKGDRREDFDNVFDLEAELRAPYFLPTAKKV